jgi:hypothetical protein
LLATLEKGVLLVHSTKALVVSLTHRLVISEAPLHSVNSLMETIRQAVHHLLLLLVRLIVVVILFELILVLILLKMRAVIELLTSVWSHHLTSMVTLRPLVVKLLVLLVLIWIAHVRVPSLIEALVAERLISEVLLVLVHVRQLALTLVVGLMLAHLSIHLLHVGVLQILTTYPRLVASLHSSVHV